jgi:hypothetical protein
MVDTDAVQSPKHNAILLLALGYTPAMLPHSLLTPHAAPAPAFSLSFSSIFLLAARIISSLLRCRFAWRSVRSWLHALALGFSSSSAGASCPTFEARLYRVMRSGCAGFGAAGARAGVAAGRGAGTVKDAGAYIHTLN